VNSLKSVSFLISPLDSLFIHFFFLSEKIKEKDLLKLNARRLMDFSENKETNSQINELSMIASRVYIFPKNQSNFRMIKYLQKPL